jgi:excisionase family DNA binding protein
MQTSDYFNTQQAAAYLQISPSTLNKRRVYGNGPPFVKMGRTVRYRRDDLNVWTDKHLRKSTSDTGARSRPQNGTEGV